MVEALAIVNDMVHEFDPFEELKPPAVPTVWEKRERWVFPGVGGYALAIFCNHETGDYRAYYKFNFVGNRWVSIALTHDQYWAIRHSDEPITFLRKQSRHQTPSEAEGH